MSNLWVPGGNQPKRPPGSAGPPPRSAPQAPPPRSRPAQAAGPEPGDEEMQAAAEAYMAQLAEAPAIAVVTNHIVQLFELARLYLSLTPPKLEDAALTIDAMNCLVEGLEGLLGEGEEQMRQAVGGLRLFYVQIKAAYPEDEFNKDYDKSQPKG